MAYAARRQKKGQSGAAAEYITRTHAVKKLQISLGDFRRLCILKGVYPREPPKLLRKKPQTFYLVKDIMFLLHDPILPKLRERRAFYKKIKRARGRRDANQVSHLERNVPVYTLDHLIRERYPTFADAVRDMDDALRMLALFAGMAQSREITEKSIATSSRLLHEFRYYVIRRNALTKVFVSIKGIYYQASIAGHPVTWLEPLQFNQMVQMPRTFDKKVMLTFLEFYHTFLGFVLFKLYTSAGLSYPPRMDHRSLAKRVFALDATVESDAPRRGVKRASPDQHDDDDDGDDGDGEDAQHSGDDGQMEERVASLSSALAPIDQEEEEEEGGGGDEADPVEHAGMVFSGLVFWLGRETPRESLAFVIRCFGGAVAYEEQGARESDPSITHHVVDRPTARRRFLDREYVQPQWVYDSANCAVPLPPSQYAVGSTLPPHLSPFVDDEEEGYIPARRAELNKLMGLEAIEQPGGASSTNQEEESLAAMEARFQKDLEDEKREADERNGDESTSDGDGSSSDGEEEEEEEGMDQEDDSSDDDDDDDDDGEDEEEEDDEEDDLPEERRSKMMMSSKQKRQFYGATKQSRAKAKEATKLNAKRRRLEKRK